MVGGLWEGIGRVVGGWWQGEWRMDIQCMQVYLQGATGLEQGGPQNCTVHNELVQGNGTPLQYSCLENPMDGGAWWTAVHGVAKSRTQLNDFAFTFHFHELEKEMATHSSVLAWRIPGTVEPDGLPSVGSHKVGHD